MRFVTRILGLAIALSAIGCVAWAGVSQEGALVVSGFAVVGLVRGVRTATKGSVVRATSLGFPAAALAVLVSAALLTPRAAGLADPLAFVAGAAVLWALEIAFKPG